MSPCSECVNQKGRCFVFGHNVMRRYTSGCMYWKNEGIPIKRAKDMPIKPICNDCGVIDRDFVTTYEYRIDGMLLEVDVAHVLGMYYAAYNIDVGDHGMGWFPSIDEEAYETERKAKNAMLKDAIDWLSYYRKETRKYIDYIRALIIEERQLTLF